MTKHKLNIGSSVLVALLAMGMAACSGDDDLLATSASTPTADSTRIEVGFDSYISRTKTRASATGITTDKLATATNITNGIGIFSMYTNGGKKYSPGTDGEEQSFSPNFLDNVRLRYLLNGYSSVSSVDPNPFWYYSPVKYWPETDQEYLSFVAYAPYRDGAKLCTKNGDTFTEGGDNPTYLKFTSNNLKEDSVDFLYTDYATTSNMQLYVGEDGNLHAVAPSDDALYVESRYNRYLLTYRVQVKLNFKHLCSRIALDLFCSDFDGWRNSNFLDPNVFQPDTTISGVQYETTNTTIEINKIVFRGDSTTDTTATPTGAFYKTAYVNLVGKSSDENPFFVGQTEDPLEYTYTGDNLVRGEGYYLTTPHPAWRPGDDTDAPHIGNNVLAGYREGLDIRSVTEIGTAKDQYIFVLPQDFTSDEEGSPKLYCYVEYTLKYRDSGFQKKLVVCKRIKQKFESGKAYCIVMDIKPEQSNAIQFHTTEEDWGDETQDYIK